MSFNWTDYVNLADELSKDNRECCSRSSVSRAYYGVFCIARNKKGFSGYRESDLHKKVIEAYKSSGDRKERAIGQALDSLRKERNDADYEKGKSISMAHAGRAVSSARNILWRMGISSVKN
jgi:uncharacterized protein (UPF0332 family)